MKKWLPFAIFLVFIASIQTTYSQQCNSSGGDPGIFDWEHRGFCGTALMKMHEKPLPADHVFVESCNNRAFRGQYYISDGKVFHIQNFEKHVLVKDADPATFRCKDNVVSDKDHVFYGHLMVAVDKASYQNLGDHFDRDKDHVYYRNYISDSAGLEALQGVQPDDFKIIEFDGRLTAYAKTSNRVYIRKQLLEDADPATFELLSHGYAKDARNVYYYDQKVEGMNGAAFKVLEDAGMGSDGVHLCTREKVWPNSDAATLQDLSCGYWRDKHHVYFASVLLDGVDSETFELLSWGFSKDKNAVYCDQRVIPGAKPATFEVLGRMYSRDDKQVFYLQKRVYCDYDSFKVDEEVVYKAEDKDRKYERGIVVGVE